MTEIPAIGVEIIILVKPVGGAVILIGAGTAEERDLPASAAAEISVGVGDADAKFLDAVDGQKGKGPKTADGVVGDINTIEHEAALIVAGAGDFAGGSSAGLEGEQLVDLASQSGKALDLGGRQDDADGGVGGLQLDLSACGDFDGLGDFAKLHFDIEGVALGDFHDKVRDGSGAKALCGGGYFVGARDDRGEGILPVGTCRGFQGQVDVEVLDGNFGTDDGGLLRIHDGTENSAGSGRLCGRMHWEEE